MMHNPILNRHCYIKRGNGKTFCSKCSHIILQDVFNMRKHACEDQFSETDFQKIFREDKDYAYGWKELGNGQYGFVVYTPKMIPISGFSEQHEKFQGGRWQSVYKCIFDAKSRQIIEQPDASRNIDYWSQFEMPCLNLLGEYESTYQIFHIPGYRNLQEFVNIFRHRGFPYQEVLTTEEARSILKWPIEVVGEDLSEEYFREKAGIIYGQVLDVKGTMVLRLDIRFYNRKRKDCKLLIANNYFFSDDEIDLDFLMKWSFRHVVSSEDLEIFALYNPDIPLMNYWEKSKSNLLIPLFASVWSEGLEELVRSGCASAANHYLGCEYMPEQLNDVYDFAKEMKTRDSEFNFLKCVQAQDYRALETGYGDEASLFEDDKFFIRVPANSTELKEESEFLQHEIYAHAEDIVNGNKKVYFLRLKKAPDLPFCTIELTAGAVRRAMNMKSFYNERPPLEVIRFVRKWAKIKDVDLCGEDFII